MAGVAGVTRMPPAGAPLTAEQVGILRAWIDQGAKWPRTVVQQRASPFARRIALVLSAHPETDVPAVQNRAWVRNPVDAFVLERLEREQIEPSPEADKATLLRRLSLDLTGLPPTPDRGGRLRSRSPARRIRTAGGHSARLTALWREMGPLLAGSCSLWR